MELLIIGQKENEQHEKMVVFLRGLRTKSLGKA